MLSLSLALMCLGLIWYARYVDSDSTAVTSRPFARTLMHGTHTHNTHTDTTTATTTQRRSERACGNWSVMLLKMLLVRPVHDQALCQVLTNTHTGTHRHAHWRRCRCRCFCCCCCCCSRSSLAVVDVVCRSVNFVSSQRCHPQKLSFRSHSF